jgi:hypothetical protein
MSTNTSTTPKLTTDVEQSTAISALIGAVVTVVTSFVPFSPIVGGAVAAYLRRGGRREGARVGAISGLIAAIPIVLILGLIFGGLSIATIVDRAVGGFLLFAGLLVISTVLVAGIVAGLSAFGGYLAAVLLERERAAGDREWTAAGETGGEEPIGGDEATGTEVIDPTADADVATGIEETTDLGDPKGGPV